MSMSNQLSELVVIINDFVRYIVNELIADTSFLKEEKSYELWKAEALFGLSKIFPYLDGLKNGSRVLEIGSGSGILLCELKSRYNKYTFKGIEPHRTCFSKFESFLV